MQEEIWKDVVGYEGLYLVSNFGRMKSVDRCYLRKRDKKEIHMNGKILNTSRISNNGYYIVNIRNKDGDKKTATIHRVVALAFIENVFNKPCVNHKNSNRLDNRVENLEWCTYSENAIHGYTKGFRKYNPSVNGKKGIFNGASKAVCRYNQFGKFVESFINARIADDETTIPFREISECCRKGKRDRHGYFWKFKDKK